MAVLEWRFEDNVSGPFYVEATCTDCDVCRSTAPTVFRRNDEVGHSWVYHQPETPDELARCREAMDACPQESIGEDGKAVDWNGLTLDFKLRRAQCFVPEDLEPLLIAGADPNARYGDGLSVLALAVGWGRESMVTLLLRYGADPNVENRPGESALLTALLAGHEGIAEALRSAGARPLTGEEAEKLEKHRELEARRARRMEKWAEIKPRDTRGEKLR